MNKPSSTLQLLCQARGVDCNCLMQCVGNNMTYSHVAECLVKCKR